VACRFTASLVKFVCGVEQVGGQLPGAAARNPSTYYGLIGNRTPPETVEQARAKHDNALRLLQRSNFTRYLTALQAGDDNMALQYSKETRSTVAERAKIVGAYAPQRAEVDVNVSIDPSAIIDAGEAGTVLCQHHAAREWVAGSCDREIGRGHRAGVALGGRAHRVWSRPH
jgi:hypothetical protein